ncbi:MAG: choice-of-anchor D domain-containing protein [Candidatus Sumerlaeaceae bacterium]
MAAKPVVTAPLEQTGSYERKAIVEPRAAVMDVLLSGSPEVTMKSVALADGTMADFEMERVQVFCDDAVVVTFNGETTAAVTGLEPVTYRGHGIGKPEQIIFVSVTPGAGANSVAPEMWMVVSDPTQTTLLEPTKTAKGSVHHLLSLAETSELENMQCDSDNLPENSTMRETFSARKTRAISTDITYDAQLLLDVSYSLYSQRFSSDATAARNYVTNLVGAVSTIYKRDINTVLSVKQLVIWTTPDPFGTTSTPSQISNYRNYNTTYRATVARNASHLLSYAPGLGGVGIIGGLCQGQNDCAVSNLNGNAVFSVSSYQWDLYVFAHELGHTFSSPHTHNYNPPIDCCATDGGSACPSAVGQAGTLMSYCHRNGTMTMNFHERCISVMRSAAEGAACLGVYVPPKYPQISVRWQGTQISSGDRAPSTADGTDYGTVEIAANVTRTFTITNTGTADLQLTGNPAIAISGVGAGDFAVTASPQTLIAPGAATTFSVRFSPSAGGGRTAGVSIASNDPQGNPFGFDVQGQAPVPAPSADLTCFWLAEATQVAKQSALGVSYSVRATLYAGNVGVLPSSGGDVVEYYLSGDTVLDATDVKIGTRTLSALKPNVAGKAPKWKKLKIKSKLSWSASGAHLLGVVKPVTDGNASNNLAISPVVR